MQMNNFTINVSLTLFVWLNTVNGRKLQVHVTPNNKTRITYITIPAGEIALLVSEDIDAIITKLK